MKNINLDELPRKTLATAHVRQHLRYAQQRAQAGDAASIDYLARIKAAAFFINGASWAVLHRAAGCGGRQMSMLSPVSLEQAEKLINDGVSRLCAKCAGGEVPMRRPPQS